MPAIADADALGAASVDKLIATGVFEYVPPRERAASRTHSSRRLHNVTVERPELAPVRARRGPGQPRRPRYATLLRLLQFSTMRIIFIRRSK